ncbi:MAG: hypothetical protein H6576_17355 [Lewinellaceae bacterium]|nr:hypothetical protein [Saprospiraceae bacterium]MCB9345459.1 hypothetical protein [Lewinellaceae bacterium]
MQKSFHKTIRTDFIFLLGFVLLFWVTACENKKTCKFKPEAMFSKELPHITDYNYEVEGAQSLESIMLDRGILLEISQDVCDETRQEFRFSVPGNFTAQPDSFWLKEATRQLVYLSTFSEKQIALKSWADIIELRRQEMKLGQDREMEPGIFVRVDKVTNPDQATLIVVLSQQ